MFGIVEWENPVTLLLEVGLSLFIVAGLLLVARRVNRSSTPEAYKRGSDSAHAQGTADESAGSEDKPQQDQTTGVAR